MFDSIQFWKKKSDLDDPLPTSTSTNTDSAGARNSLGLDLQTNPANMQQTQPQAQISYPFGQEETFQPEQPQYNQPATPQQPTQQSNQDQMSARDVELILSKLDTIKVSLDNLTHRMDRIEQQQNQPQQRRTW